MSHPTKARTPLHRHTPSGSAAPRWISVMAAVLTVAAIPAIAAPLAPKDIRVVKAAEVALTAQPSGVVNPVNHFDAPRADDVAGTISVPVVVRQSLNSLPGNAIGGSISTQDTSERADISVVIDDFEQGGLAQVLLHQLTSRTTDPDQLQILNDFFEGGVFQSEAHRFLQLFQDPQQQQFIRDFVTGGLVQVVRNRLLDATTDPQMRQAIINFFPDEVTDYRGGPLTVLQRRLIAAAKGNTTVIALVNAVFDNPVVTFVRHVIGGGPIIGTPLDELPDPPATSLAAPDEDTASKTPTPAVVEKTAVASASARRATPEPAAVPAEATTPPAEPAASSAALESSPAETTEPAAAATTSSDASKSKTDAKPEAGPHAPDVADVSDVSDAIKTGNKVEPTTTPSATRPKPGGGLGIFGQVAEGIAKTLAGGDAAATAPAAAGGVAEGASSEAGVG
jgi:hypothetical protein